MEVRRKTVLMLVSRLSSASEHARSESLAELRLLTKHDPDIRPIVAQSGAVRYVAEGLYSNSHETQENAAATLLNISITSRDKLISAPEVLDALSHALRHHSSTTNPVAVQAAAATIYSLLVVESYRLIIGSKRDILYSLVDIIRTTRSPPRSIKDSLKALFLLAQCPQNRSALIGLGSVEALLGVVMRDARVGIVEDTTAVIAQVAACGDSEAEFARISGVRVLVDLLDPVTGSTVRIKENVVSALLNLIRNGGEDTRKEVQEYIAGVKEGVTEVLEKGTEKGRAKTTALLDILQIQ